MIEVSRHVKFAKRERLIFDALFKCRYGAAVSYHSTWRRLLSTSDRRPAKRVSTRQVKDLVQGRIGGEPLPPADQGDLEPASLLQVIRGYMRKFPNCVLLTKVGNFYELYYEHADEYAPKLGLRVASKGKDGVSMAGFQYQYLDKYLKKLVQELDKHVAICEEFPTYENGKVQSPIPRRVTRVITPGTLIDEEFVDQEKNNFLLSIFCRNPDPPSSRDPPKIGKNAESNIGLAWIDISTGEFYVQATDRVSLSSALLRIGASEAVVSSEITGLMREEIALSLGLSVDRLATTTFDTSTDRIDSWIDRLDRPLPEQEKGLLSPYEMTASQQLFEYIDRHILEMRIKPRPPQRKEQMGLMSIDRSSIRGLELLKTARDGLGKGSLLNTIQRTVTKGGARLLRERLIYPSVTLTEIEHRLNLVSAFIAVPDLHQTLVAHLRKIYDVVRLAQKLVLNRGDADEMLCLANTFLRMKDMMQLLEKHQGLNCEQETSLRQLVSRFVLEGPENMAIQIRGSIDEQGVTDWLSQDENEMVEGRLTDASVSEEDGSLGATQNGQDKTNPIGVDNDFPLVMQRNASAGLAKLHSQLATLQNDKIGLQKSLQEQLNAPRLVLKHDSKYGHICQTPRTKGFSEDALKNIGASLVGNMKTVKSFYLTSWTSLGRQIESIKFEIRQEEQKIFERLRELVVENLVPLRQNASVMDELDLATSFATLALDEEWTRPKISSGPVHQIVGGRHPTVKLGLQERGQSFVSNDLHLDRTTRVWLITGPNMAGKSTFLRQNALITILAQMGSYVPAEYAEIGIVDKIFSRIGAADDLFRNESTFMVEMLETASILRDATERSFVIMDEVGRGTAPEDGTAVAYASLHHLYTANQCRTLFATHFHELADKTADWAHLKQYCTDLYQDSAGSFRFIHKLRPGVNKKSHALRVAKMAGLPQSALDMAQDMLATGQEKSKSFPAKLARKQEATDSIGQSTMERVGVA